MSALKTIHPEGAAGFQGGAVGHVLYCCPTAFTGVDCDDPRRSEGGRRGKAVKPAQQRSAMAPLGHKVRGSTKGPQASALPGTVPFLKYFLGRK
jgi:hypothetical protein